MNNTPVFSDLETERLWLRQIDMAHKEDIFRQFSSAEVSRYLLDEEPFTSVQEAEGLISWYTEPLPRDHHRWVLLRKADGAFVGTCGFHRWDTDNNIAEIGYDLFPSCWGQGYMNEALNAAIEHGFTAMGLNRIQAFVYPQNQRSARLLQRLGFQKEGVFRDKHLFRGVYYDHLVFSLLRREWREWRAEPMEKTHE